VPPPAQGKTAGQKGQDAGKSAQKKQKQKKQSGRDAVITAERTDYDRKEGVILFDRNVYVDDEQYQLHADRLFLFLDGTNDLKRLVALGNVAITNEEKNASCSRAVYVKKLSKIVMYGSDAAPARLYQGGKKASTVVGERITFWLNSEQVEIEKPVVTVPGGSFKGGDGKDFLKNFKQ
jgi:lipopolysaccharide transport protein LptA